MSVRLEVMRPFAAWAFGVSLAGAVGCGGTSSGDATSGSSLFATKAGVRCGHAAGVDDGGVGACAVGRAGLFCGSPNGAGCFCVTDDATCGGCGGAACTNKCTGDEYAVSCGGPPHADSSFQYAGPPAGCRTTLVTPAGSQFFCCPCQ